MKTFLCVALSCILISLCHADGSTTTVNVAFVEPIPSSTADGSNTLIMTNANRYLKAIKDLEKQNKPKPDIVVLPEYGLTGITYDKTQAINIDPNNVSSSEDLQSLQALAETNKVIIVANLLETDGDDLYSTTVVLDGTTTNTKLLAKYRKINLKEGDEEKNLKSAEEVVTFKHSTLGTVGILSGDDILHENPVKQLKEQKVTTILYTSSQKVVAPFKSTVSFYAGFAKAHGVNLVVSNLNNVDSHISGSGIFAPCTIVSSVIGIGDGYDIASIDATPVTNCAKSFGVRNILRPLSTDQKTRADLPEYDLEGFTNKTIKADIKEEKLCDGDFCCYFTVSASSSNWNSENYRLEVKGGDQKICGMILCSDDKDENSLKNCGRVSTTTTGKTVFKVNITTTEGESLFVPYVLHSDLSPNVLSTGATSDFTEASDKGTTFTISEVKDVLAIGIVSATKSAANSLGIAMNILVISVILKYIF